MKKNILTLTVGALIAALLILYLIAFQLGEYQRGVVTTFGKPTRSLSEPGLYWKLPWPFQKVYIFDGRLFVEESVFEETYTGDGKNLIFTTCIGWKISDPALFLERIGTVDAAKRNLDGLVRTYKNGVLGRHTFDQLVSANGSTSAYEQIEAEIFRPVAEEAQTQYGVHVGFLYITQLGLPEQTTAQVFERMKKERQRIAEKYRSEGDAIASEIKAKAQSEHDQIIARAQAEAKKIRGEGDAQAAEFYKIFEENKQLAVFLKKMETLKTVLKDKSTVILDTQTAPFDLLDTRFEESGAKPE